MIGGTTMAAVIPASPTPPDTGSSTPSTSTAAADPSSQPATATSTDQASAKPAKAAGHDHPATRTPASGDDTSDFERLLESDVAPAVAAAAGGSAKPAAVDETKAPATASAPQNPSLADQLLGLLGMLGTPAAAPPPAPGNGAETPLPAPAAAATPAAPAMSTLALAQPAPVSDAPITTATSAIDTAHAPGTGIATEFVVDRATRDASAAIGGDLATIPTRDPASVVAPTPLPVSVDKLPSVPQPALMQPANPDAGYGDDLGSSVMWMAEHRIGHAAMQVSPDHLGPIEVRLQLDGARVHAEFYSAQPEVRHALEASLPRLRDLLGQQGLQLGQADVGQRHRDDTRRAPMPANGQGDCFPDDPRPLPTTLRRARGLVDEYA
jgi:flagellar hook-length control protein FliK